MEIKNFAMKFSKDKAREERNKFEGVKTKVEILESIESNKITTSIKNEIERLIQFEYEYMETKSEVIILDLEYLIWKRVRVIYLTIQN